MKKEPKKEKRPVWILLIVLAVIFNTGAVCALLKNAQETNRLLSTFQRIDTVKDDTAEFRKAFDYAKEHGGLMVLKGIEPQEDANICDHYKSICTKHENGPSTCEIVCEMGVEQ